LQALVSFWGTIWGMITGANLNAVIAIFTIVIAGTTIVYAWVTWKLLKQSRWALLVDTIIRIMEHTEERSQQYVNEVVKEVDRTAIEITDKLRKAKLEQDIKRQWEEIEKYRSELKVKMDIEPHFMGMYAAIRAVNEKLAKDFYKPIGNYVNKRKEVINEAMNKFDTLKNKMRHLIKELEKQAKSEDT